MFSIENLTPFQINHFPCSVQKQLDVVRTPKDAPKFDIDNEKYHRDDEELNKRLCQLLLSLHKSGVKMNAAIAELKAEPSCDNNRIVELGQVVCNFNL